jgi:DNA-binding transcriptional MerR regulator
VLTIGQVATHLGLTVRAIRYYQERGLIAEPQRDSSGYRRYDAAAVAALIRIKTLSEAGVPLARIEELMTADPEQFHASLAALDQELAAQIRDLTLRRARIAALGTGDRLFLPEAVVALFDDLRRIGASDYAIQVERDSWILLSAQFPNEVAQWAQAKRDGLADPAFQRLYLLIEEIAGWDPDDPRLDAVADQVNALGGLQDPQANGVEPILTVEATLSLITAHVGKPLPAVKRLFKLCLERTSNTGL